ncbi:hypothetical protein BH10CHL1_BH10CHL1_39550 [soil metagenome]
MNRFVTLLPTVQSKVRLASMILVSFTVVIIALMSTPLTARAVDSTPVTAGFRDFSYPAGTGGDSSPTGEKPESRIWWNDGFWWGSLWSMSGSAYHIYQLNGATQTWLDTGVAVDDRNASRADALWDGQQLYVVSPIFADNSGQAAPAGQRGELYRYSYNAGAKSYSLDSGYPVEVTLGKSEALVLDKDSTGRLWVTYVESQKVMVNHSLAADNQWGTPYVLPVADATALNNDDIASLISFNGQIGVMWSNHTTQKMYFAIHQDNALDNVWQGVSIYAPTGAAADDHINLKSLQTDNAGSVFAVLKTSFSSATSPLINLLVCTSGTTCTSATDWQPYVVYKKQDHHTRAILLIDTTNRTLNVFSTTGESGGTIYRKSTPIDNIAFATGHGTPFIQSATDTAINNATSTKQNVNSTTGLVVLASDANTHSYLHNYLSLTNSAIPSVAFSNATYSVAENGGTATITVNLSKALTSTVTVNYATSNGAAIAGSDYSATSGSLTFAAGTTSQSFTVSITDDLLDENAEIINLTLSNPMNAQLGAPATATLTLTDNDNPPTVQFSNATYNVNENGGTATITATLSNPSGLAATINYATSNGNATASSDYTAVNGTLTFNPGETLKTFTVPILQDPSAESSETINLALSGPNNATLGTPAAAVLTIIDDDISPSVQFSNATYSVNENGGTATVTVTLSTPSGLAATVNYATSGGTATVGNDYQASSGALTFSPGQTIKTFVVPIVEDLLDENDETINLTLSAPGNATLGATIAATLTIIDNDNPPTVDFSNVTYSVNENGGTATVTALLSAASGLPVTVNYATSNGTAIAGSDYQAAAGALTFAPGETSKTFVVSILYDALDENNETIDLTLSAPNHATLGTPASVTLTITDNDNPPTVQFSAPNYSVGETAGSALITATLNAASGLTVTVHYASSNGTATAGNDYSAAAGILTFSPGQMVKAFGVSVVADNLDESDETLHLALNNPNHASLGAPSNALLTILDATPTPPTPSAPTPSAPTVQLSATSYAVDEQAGAALVTVTLSAATNGPLTVDYATSNGTATAGSDYTATSGTLTFQPGQISQSLTLPLLDDTLDENDETFNLLLGNAHNATLGLTTSATLTLVDNDAPPTVQFGAPRYLVNAENPSVLVEVKLSAASGLTVTVNYVINQVTALANATNGILLFSPGETSKTLAIELVPTGSSGPATDMTVALAQPSNASLGAVDTTTLAVVVDSSAKVYLPFVMNTR